MSSAPNNVFANSKLDIKPCTPEMQTVLVNLAKDWTYTVDVNPTNIHIKSADPTKPTLMVYRYRIYYYVHAVWPEDDSNNYQKDSYRLLPDALSVIYHMDIPRDVFKGGNAGINVETMLDTLKEWNFLPDLLIDTSSVPDTAYLQIKYSSICADIVIVNGYYIYCCQDRCMSAPATMSLAKQAISAISDIIVEPFRQHNAVMNKK